MTGDAGKGSVVFQKNCAICHQVGGISGISYGPDLASIRNRELQFILADIINPNRSIADGFENWTITLLDGKKEKGIISNETPFAITLKEAGGKEKTIQRSQVKSLESDKTSAMPPGLESNISIPEMADLLAYLKKGK
jgi:putative heme-binding domain-containing protein